MKNTYLSRLKNKREVYINSELIQDVTNNSYFKGAIDIILEYYDLMEKKPDVFTYKEKGNIYHISTLIPRNREDLIKKRLAYKAVADLSFGMLGRTPDFINAAIAALAANSHILGGNEFTNFSKNAIQFYERCRQNHLFIGHGSVNPQIDRSTQLGLQDNQYCGVKTIRADANGIVVSGAKMIVTLAPIADELLIFNMPGLQAGDEDYAIAFTVPVTAKGLKLICRKPLTHNSDKYNKLDYPIANLFDECDSYLILQNVFIPWENVFIYRDIYKSNIFYDHSRIRNHNGHQGIVRGLAKAELLTSVAIELAKKMSLDGFLNVQEQLGEMTTCLELVRGAILLSESDAFVENELINPSIPAIQSLRYHFPKWYQRMIQIIQSLAAGSMLSVPHHGDLKNENSIILNESLKNSSMDSFERIFLLNLAWDLTGNGFGQRQLVYEIYHAGDPIRIAAIHFKNYDKRYLEKHLDYLRGKIND